MKILFYSEKLRKTKIFVIGLSSFLICNLKFATMFAQNIGINTDGSVPETSVMLDIKAPNAKATTAFQNYLQLKSFDNDNSALKLRFGLQTHATATSRFGQIEVIDTAAGSASYRSLSLQPSGGYVGIGTTSPGVKLHLQGSTLSGANLQQEFEDLNGNDLIMGISTADRFDFVKAGTGAFMSLDIANQRVGIGTTSPALTLHVAADANEGFPATSGTSQKGAFRIRSGSNVVMDFGNNSGGSLCSWIQSTDQTGLGTNYSLLLNPNGGNIGIGTGTSIPASSAVLDITSTTKGLLPPRMTTAQRNAISGPVEALLIYNTDTKCFEAYNSTTSAWVGFGCIGCTLPSAPTTGTHTPSQTQIIWNWNTVSGATGYKYNTTNNYGTATDNLTNVSYTQTGLTCSNTYTLYVWAYNNCGNSSATTLSQAASTCTVTFTYTGGDQTWDVPAGITSINVDARGAGGQGGGNGGRVQTTLAVTPGETLHFQVGGTPTVASTGGYNGGGTGTVSASGAGGGASDVRQGGTALANRVIVAGGGGGKGQNTGSGGKGGGTTGEAGPNAGAPDATGGGGGTPTAGGAAGGGGGTGGSAGSLGVGGNGFAINNHGGSYGGGGGGGYYGGGGGGAGSDVSTDWGAGGGGGSSYAGTGTSGTTHTQGYSSGNGQIIITW